MKGELSSLEEEIISLKQLKEKLNAEEDKEKLLNNRLKWISQKIEAREKDLANLTYEWDESSLKEEFRSGASSYSFPKSKWPFFRIRIKTQEEEVVYAYNQAKFSAVEKKAFDKYVVKKRRYKNQEVATEVDVNTGKMTTIIERKELSSTIVFIPSSFLLYFPLSLASRK